MRYECPARRPCLIRPAAVPAHCVSCKAAATPTTDDDLAHHQLNKKQRQQVDCFLEHLLAENEKYNLTAVKDADGARLRHAADSLALLGVIESHLPAANADAVSLMDVGSGPGLPGCILAIARPSWQVRPECWQCGVVRSSSMHPHEMPQAIPVLCHALCKLHKRYQQQLWRRRSLPYCLQMRASILNCKAACCRRIAQEADAQQR